MSVVRSYRAMLAQRDRIEAFRRAIELVVRPGDRVLDVGTGLGTFALFAVQSGAERVWAIDADPVVYVAKAVAAVNGVADRIEFVRGRVPAVDIPERCDVVLFEDFPPRLLGPSAFRMLRDVRERYAADGARMLPSAARIFLAPVVSPRLRREVLSFEGPDADRDDLYGLDWSPTRSYVANGPLHTVITPEDLAAPGVPVATFRFDADPDVHCLGGEAAWTVEREGPIDGIAFWFDLDLTPGVCLSNAPGAVPASWGQMFLPFGDALAVAPGDRIAASAAPGVLVDGAPGWLAWEASANGVRVRGNEFAAEPAARADVVELSPDVVPALDEVGAIEAEVLALTDGRRTVAEIIEEVVARRPEIADSALDNVTRVLRGRCIPGIPNEV